MRHFVELLSRWRGRSTVQRELEERGYVLPARYQESIASSCAPEARIDLDLFWDEDAREYVCSAGQANTATRSFPDFHCYRSEYLDVLASVRKPSSLFRVNPLHPCLVDFATKQRTEPAFAQHVVETIQLEKRAEIRRLKIQAEQWSGQKADIRGVFEDLMNAKGFRRRGGAYCKQSNSGLLFSGLADLGGRPFCVAVPFHFFIADGSDEQLAFEFSPVRVFPGFWFYQGFDTVEAGLLGFQAYVEMIDIMSRSFD